MANDTEVKMRPYFDLKIELILEEKNVVRIIRVGANITFERLHKIIQAAYNWQESHLYKFLLFKDGEEREKPSFEIVIDKEDAANPKNSRLAHRAKLCDYLREYKHILYMYDFGDSWIHYIDVTDSGDDCKQDLPILMDGANDAPPEDCGGPEGFADFLKIIRKPKHEEYKEMKMWAKDQGWEHFDINRAGLRVFMAGNPGRRVWVKENKLKE